MKWIAWSLMILAGLLARGQYTYTEGCLQAHEHINAMRFDKARAMLQAERHNNPANLIPVALEGYIDFLVVIIDDDKAGFDNLRDSYQEKLLLLQEGDKDSPWYRSLIARMSLQRAFAQLKFGRYFNAALEIRKSYILLAENSAEYPGFLPDKVGLGLLHALIGSIPDNFRWVAGMFSMDGSVEQGRQELLEVLENKADDDFPFTRDEALFFLTYIDLNLQPDKARSLDLLPYYHNLERDNLLLFFSKARILMQTARNDEAIEMLVHRPAGNEYHPFYYLDYLAGQAKLNRLDPDASIYLLRFVTNTRGTSYVKAAYQKLAWHWLLQGQTGRYHENMEKVLRYGDKSTDADRLAYSEATSATIPNTCLLRARLLFDGGYYERAEQTLLNPGCRPDGRRDEIEFPYRLGRIRHALNDHAAALTYYDLVISTGSAEQYYFAANAALQAGTICESQGRFEEAEAYYRKCLKMPNTEYRNSLGQKARAGLNRLRDKTDNRK